MVNENEDDTLAKRLIKEEIWQRDNAEAIAAAKLGLPIQGIDNAGNWFDINPICSNLHCWMRYRVKPQKKYREYTTRELVDLFGCPLSCKSDPDFSAWKVYSVSLEINLVTDSLSARVVLFQINGSLRYRHLGIEPARVLLAGYTHPDGSPFGVEISE